jgi:DNA-binding HxlR family transcriptional regulator
MNQLLELLASVWTVQVMRLLSRKTYHFSALKRGVNGISAKVLTTRLRELEQQGLVARKVIPSSPPTVQYEITALLRICSFIDQLEVVAQESRPSIEQPVAQAAQKDARQAAVQLVAL